MRQAEHLTRAALPGCASGAGHDSQPVGRSLEQRCGIAHSWLEVLLRVPPASDGQMSMGALAEQIVLTSGGVTRLVDRIIGAGYLRRVPCASDRRVSYAAITPEGRGKDTSSLWMATTALPVPNVGYAAVLVPVTGRFHRIASQGSCN